jgi:hypothetical protein
MPLAAEKKFCVNGRPPKTLVHTVFIKLLAIVKDLTIIEGGADSQAASHALFRGDSQQSTSPAVYIIMKLGLEVRDDSSTSMYTKGSENRTICTMLYRACSVVGLRSFSSFFSEHAVISIPKIKTFGTCGSTNGS